MAREAVLDASAVLALVNGEPGADRVAQTIPGALLCSVNLAEVVGKLADTGMPEQAVRSVLGGLGLSVVSFDADLAWRAGLLRPVTRSAGLSIGDRACLALAAKNGLPAMTSDRVWSTLHLEAEVELIR